MIENGIGDKIYKKVTADLRNSSIHIISVMNRYNNGRSVIVGKKFLLCVCLILDYCDSSCEK